MHRVCVLRDSDPTASDCPSCCPPAPSSHQTPFPIKPIAAAPAQPSPLCAPAPSHRAAGGRTWDQPAARGSVIASPSPPLPSRASPSPFPPRPPPRLDTLALCYLAGGCPSPRPLRHGQPQPMLPHHEDAQCAQGGRAAAQPAPGTGRGRAAAHLAAHPARRRRQVGIWKGGGSVEGLGGDTCRGHARQTRQTPPPDGGDARPRPRPLFPSSILPCCPAHPTPPPVAQPASS